VDVVCCGHSHLAAAAPAGPVQYFNSGCWTEKPCHYLAVTDGRVELKPIHDTVEVHDADGGPASRVAPAA
jgi:UDP-2,3-diacylglucosamine pyrophosphatase LpxH